MHYFMNLVFRSAVIDLLCILSNAVNRVIFFSFHFSQSFTLISNWKTFCLMQLLYELCVDPLTRVPTMDLLSNKKYQFFVKVNRFWCIRALFLLPSLFMVNVNCPWEILNSFPCYKMQHIDTICIAALPKRNSNQPLRISSLHQVFLPDFFHTNLL